MPMLEIYTLNIIEKVASGISAIHKARISHRGISAKNIAFDVAGNLKIVNFSMAAPIDGWKDDDGGMLYSKVGITG